VQLPPQVDSQLAIHRPKRKPGFHRPCGRATATRHVLCEQHIFSYENSDLKSALGAYP
jgi:hypothetical protein